jgi:hypothetical protein
MPEGGRADLQFTEGPLKPHLASDRIPVEEHTGPTRGQAISVAPAAKGVSCVQHEPIAGWRAAAMHTQPWHCRPICRGAEQEVNPTRDGGEVLNPFIAA